ncbi:hypothetical protein B0J18DRAFT_430826 [Chaetomium sp. MPI-SDFR-AT-0129]|nr:hypothetical protein B0J18DRAFT_430826 [Chaetomium sp. MPI-SDFR-AT-0129]
MDAIVTFHRHTANTALISSWLLFLYLMHDIHPFLSAQFRDKQTNTTDEPSLEVVCQSLELQIIPFADPKTRLSPMCVTTEVTNESESPALG